MSKTTSHYADDKVFRSGNGSEVIEVFPPRRDDGGFVISLDSWDSPGESIRLSVEASEALITWMADHLKNGDR